MRKMVPLILGWLLACGTALAKDGDPSGIGPAAAWDETVVPAFRHLTSDDGLPYPVALGVAEDGKGFIWAATPGGVVRWDGHLMKVFRHDDADPNSLPENLTTAALADERGRVWFSTVSGVIVRFDDTTQGFVAYTQPGENLGRPFGMASGNGAIWVAGRQGLFRLDAASGAWQREADLPEGEVGSVLVDRSGRLWAGTAKGVALRRGAGQPFEVLAMPAAIPHATASALFEDRAGAIWFGTNGGHVGRVNRDGTTTLIERAVAPTGHRVTAFAEPHPGTLWIAQYGGGIQELRPGTGLVRRFAHDATNPASLGDDTITGLLIDRSGMVWASSLRGLQRHIPNNRQVMSIFPQRGGLPSPDVRSVAATRDGKLWLGFRAGGLALLDPVGKAPIQYPGSWQDALPKGSIQAIADTGDGILWAGHLAGLARIETASGRVVPYAPLAGANILVLRQDGAALWAGGSMGLASIPPDGSPPRLHRSELDDPASLSDNSVMAVFRDRAQRLWVGTQRGLNLLEDAEAGRFRRFFSDPNDRESLPGDAIISIAEDGFGRLWLATSNGIAIFDPEQQGKPRFTRLGTAQGLRNSTILSIAQGDGGRMIAGTGDGLAVIDPQTLAIRMLGPADGVEIKTFWAGSVARMADGTLALGGFGGMAVVRPGGLPQRTYHPPVVATEIRVGTRVVSNREDIVVHPEDGGVQVDFAALDFSEPELNRYAYRLDGAPWTDADFHHRTASYTNLAPGSHRLEIKGGGSDGVWGAPLVLDIRVLPKWHQTAWFYLLATMAGGGLLVGATQVRNTYHRRREQELSHQVRVKTAEVEAAMRRALAGEEDARRAKEAAEEANRLKSRVLAIIGHEIRTPLNGLLGMLQVLGLRADDWREVLGTANKAGENLRELVESILEYGREGTAGGKVVFSDFDVRQLVQQATELMRSPIAAKGLTLALAMPDEAIRIRSDRGKLSRILLNLLGNAVKFTDHGTVAVDVALAQGDGGHRLSVAIADTGIGVAPDMKEVIFGEFVQADDTITRNFGGVGLGLAISRRMAEQLGGTLTLESGAQGGSIFRLDVPVAEAAAADAPSEAAPGPDDRGLRVLVVDDHELNRQVAERMLARLGHRPVMATDGRSAIAALARQEFDVVLLDLHMPDMDGMEVARRIRQGEGRQAEVRIIAMSADLGDEIGRQCAAAGVDGELPKPLDMDRLRATLASTGSARPDAP